MNVHSSLVCTEADVKFAEYMVKDAKVDFGSQHSSGVSGRTEATQQQLADVRCVTPFEV